MSARPGLAGYLAVSCNMLADGTYSIRALHMLPDGRIVPYLLDEGMWLSKHPAHMLAMIEHEAADLRARLEGGGALG